MPTYRHCCQEETSDQLCKLWGGHQGEIWHWFAWVARGCAFPVSPFYHERRKPSDSSWCIERGYMPLGLYDQAAACSASRTTCRAAKCWGSSWKALQEALWCGQETMPYRTSQGETFKERCIRQYVWWAKWRRQHVIICEFHSPYFDTQSRIACHRICQLHWFRGAGIICSSFIV